MFKFSEVTRRVRNREPSRVQLKNVIQSLKFSKLRQAWESRFEKTIPVSSVLQWVVLLQIINSDKQDSSKEKIVSIATILSNKTVKNYIIHLNEAIVIPLAYCLVLPCFCARS